MFILSFWIFDEKISFAPILLKLGFAYVSEYFKNLSLLIVNKQVKTKHYYLLQKYSSLYISNNLTAEKSCISLYAKPYLK